MTDYNDAFKNWPDWSDSDKKVDAIFEDGTFINGTLLVDDFGFDGEDEYPIFVIDDGQGNKRSFAEVKKFRFV